MSEVDNKIIDGCLKGKRRDQNKLYAKYSPVLFGLCLRYSRNRDEAEDILQEGFIKIFLNIKAYRGEGSFEGWMKRIMVNTAITHNKQSLKHQFHTDIDEIEETSVLAEDTTAESDGFKLPKQQLMGIIQGLPQGYRMVFNMYVFEQYTHKEIAQILNVSENTSKSQLSKARKMLSKKIRQLAGNEKINITE